MGPFSKAFLATAQTITTFCGLLPVRLVAATINLWAGFYIVIRLCEPSFYQPRSTPCETLTPSLFVIVVLAFIGVSLVITTVNVLNYRDL